MYNQSVAADIMWMFDFSVIPLGGVGVIGSWEMT